MVLELIVRPWFPNIDLTLKSTVKVTYYRKLFLICVLLNALYQYSKYYIYFLKQDFASRCFHDKIIIC